jgi:hypothetical protein
VTDIARSALLRFARHAALCAGLAAAGLGVAPLAAQTAPPSASFEAARQRLEIGGPVFAFMDFEDEVLRLGRDLTAIVAELVGDDPELAIYRQDFGRILDELGIAGVKAVGLSSTVRRDGGYHNRAFLHVPGQRRGFLAALGGPAKPFATARLAPADTDLFLEFELDVPALVQAITTVAERFLPGAGTGMLSDAIAAGSGVEAAEGVDILASLRGRITLALRLGETGAPDAARLEEWALGLAQKGNLLLRVEGVGQRLVPLLQKVSEVTQSSVDGRTVFRASEIVPILGENQPAIVIDGNDLLLGSSLAFVQQSLARTDGLAQAPGFQRTLGALGLAEGNALSYLTPRIFEVLRVVMGAAMESSSSGENEAMGPMLQALLGRLTDVKEPLASITANVPEGIVLHANSTSSMRGAMLSLGVYNPDLLGPIALAVVPSLVKAQIDSRQAARSVEIAEANLKLIGEAALAFLAANPKAEEVSYRDLEAQLKGRLGPIKGLDFTDFTLERGFSKIELELPNGQSVVWVAPFTDEQREQVRRNLQAFDRAAAWYFRKYPQETLMLGLEAVEDGSPMPDFPAPVRGENYRDLQIHKTDAEIRIEVGDEIVSIRRDPALQRPQQRQPQRQQQQQQRQQQQQPPRGG